MARTTDPKLVLIAAVPLFAGCSKKELGQVALAADEIDVREGKVLTTEGDPGREFFVLVEGAADVRRKGRKVNELGPGDFLGEIALIDRGPRTATAIAAEPCRLLVLDIGGFRTLISKYPTVQGKIMRALAVRLREAQPRAVV